MSITRRSVLLALLVRAACPDCPEKKMNITFVEDLDAFAFTGGGDDDLFQTDDSCLVYGSFRFIMVSSIVITWLGSFHNCTAGGSNGNNLPLVLCPCQLVTVAPISHTPYSSPVSLRILWIVLRLTSICSSISWILTRLSFSMSHGVIYSPWVATSLVIFIGASTLRIPPVPFIN